MKTIRLSIIASLACMLLCAISRYESFAQGCSDAGFCTIGNLRLQQRDSLSEGQKITLLLPVGVGDEGVFVFTPAIQYENQLSGRWAAQVKLTANYANGNLGNALGLGDLLLSGTRSFRREEKWTSSVTFGTKVPLNLGNLKEDGKSLPMQYQSSLGTIDFIAGFSLSNASWQFSTGWQQPVSGINRNNFLPVYWNSTEADKYPPSNDFNRKGDVLLRAAYMSNIKRSLSINFGLLAIYHIAEDTYIDASVSNNPIAIKGSQGLTLNATAAGFWKISNRINMGFSVGVPFVVRDVRPDGLTRSFVFAPEIRWNL